METNLERAIRSFRTRRQSAAHYGWSFNRDAMLDSIATEFQLTEDERPLLRNAIIGWR